MRHNDNEETTSNRNYTEILSREIVQRLKNNKLQVHVSKSVSLFMKFIIITTSLLLYFYFIDVYIQP